MGPVAVFDKSFIQSLNINESVWFDNFFSAVITPYFYVETLADLYKSSRRGKTPEEEVTILAEKTPELSSTPTQSHSELCLVDLLGHSVNPDGRPFLAGGKEVKFGDKEGTNFELSPEAEAFNRWMDGDYLSVEKKFAENWREAIKGISYDKVEKHLSDNKIDFESCKNLNDAYNEADKFVNRKLDQVYFLMKYIFESLSIPQAYQSKVGYNIMSNVTKSKSLNEIAPYASYVIKVNIFFDICIKRGFISDVRKSNKIDISYLYYLPFCMIFISTDKLHRNCVPLFLKEKQEFIWGADLKNGLKEIDIHYSSYPDTVKEKGIFSFASRPPKDKNLFVSQLWNKHMIFDFEEDINPKEKADIDDVELLKHLKQMKNAPINDSSSQKEEMDFINLDRSVRKKKGNWYQIPKNMK